MCFQSLNVYLYEPKQIVVFVEIIDATSVNFLFLFLGFELHRLIENKYTVL